MKKRILSLVLSLLLILPAFTGCGNEPDIPTQTAETEETAPDTTLPASGTEEETIPEVITFDVPQTIDFGEFAGVRKYNLLIDWKANMMYIAADATDKDITWDSEPLYRFLLLEQTDGA